MSQPDPLNNSDEVKRKVLAGDKIGAIKLYRELTGVGLAEAKSAVEQLQTRLRGFESAEIALPKSSSDTSLPKSNAAINEAIFAGKKIVAIKLYREQTKAGLAEAKRAVEEIEKQLRASAPGLFAKPAAKGCFAAIFFLLGAGSALWRLIA
ncbi:MAG: ribosomal protein L7/L12 [Chthoniobacter sp.]